MVDSNLNNLKKHIFFEFLNLVSRAFVLVRYSDEVILGNRGFTAEEKENGIILVFNSRMNFLWDDYGITATLVFGTSPQKCFIPVDNIIAVYSPELNAQFVVSLQPAAISTPHPALASRKEDKKTEPKVEQKTLKNKKQTGHVIKVDFTKKRK